MAEAGPYFIKKATDSVFMGADGEWYNRKSIIANPAVLCKFDTLETAQEVAKREHQKRGVPAQACRAKTVKKHLVIADSSWELYLPKMRYGLISQPNTGAESVTIPKLDIYQAQKEDDDSEVILESVKAAPAVSEELNNTPLIVETIEVLSRLQTLSVQWQNVLDTNADKLKETDKAITDELHFVEFMNLDMQRAYRSYKRIHELRLRRRQLKDEYTVVGEVCTALHTTPNPLFSNIAHALSYIGGLKNRKYAPRVTWPVEDDLFNYPKAE